MSAVNVTETTNKLNKEINSTKIKFPELDEIEVRDLIITKLLLRSKRLDRERR